MTFSGVFRGSDVRLIVSAAPDSDWRKQSWWLDLISRLTLSEVQKLVYIMVTGPLSLESRHGKLLVSNCVKEPRN